MTLHAEHAAEATEYPEGHLDGMLDYSARCSIRDLIRRYGFEEARDRVAFILNDEADRKPRKTHA